MKNIILIGVISLLSNLGFSQNIIDFFKIAPDSSLLGLSKELRAEIAKVSSDNDSLEDAIKDLNEHKLHYAFEVVDVKNGYLKLMGSFEGHIQMCYWNLSNGNKLIAIYEEGCGPVCYVGQFDFYEYDGKNFISKNLKDIIPEIFDKFFKGDPENQIEKMKKEDEIATLLYELPRNGKNIIAKWGNEGGKETYVEYARGNRMTLTWKDGKFEKGKIYWN